MKLIAYELVGYDKLLCFSCAIEAETKTPKNATRNTTKMVVFKNEWVDENTGEMGNTCNCQECGQDFPII